MRVMITGATGLLGQALLRTTNHSIIPCFNNTSPNDQSWWKLDITDKNAVNDVVRETKPDIIINCAAIGSVDKVQTDFGDGLNVNLIGTMNLLAAAKEHHAKFVMVSTNAVFDGRNPRYNELANLAPVNHYGIIKAAAELVVRASQLDWIVVRPILMYGCNHPSQRSNWVNVWMDKLLNNIECHAVDDVFTQPLYNYSCATAIWAAIALNKWNEIYNLAGPDIVTFADFAVRVAKCIGADPALVRPVKSSYFTTIAPRPSNTCYDNVKMNNLNIENHTIEAGISHMLQLMAGR